jgi:CxxC motif-containing protein (DUF1111 family)
MPTTSLNAKARELQQRQIWRLAGPLVLAHLLVACGSGAGASGGPVGAVNGGDAHGGSGPGSTPTTGGGASTAGATAEPGADPVPAPDDTGASDYVPLFPSGGEPIEQIQTVEADGTLITYAGFRPTNRHAREGGEPWQQAEDEGPGNYFTFPTFYFQNRTYGLIIVDEVPAGRQKVSIYLQPSNGTFINVGLSAFRRADPGVGEYGWEDNTGFDNVKAGNKRCDPGQELEDLCSIKPITDYWRSEEDNRADKTLKVGDKIELAPAQFLDNTDGKKALIDGGGIRYYSFEQLYVVGKGMAPWYGVAPKLDSHPLPDSALLAGQASVSYNYSEEPHRVFQQSVNNIGIADMQRFVEGRRLFHTSFVDGKHSESPDVNPVFEEHTAQIGERYNEVRCLGCHQLNGRSPAVALGERLVATAVLTAASSSHEGITADPTYGFNVQQVSSVAGAADYSVSVSSYTTRVRELADGETVELAKPVYRFKGPEPAQYSVRQAPQVIGLGLLEALDETTILGLADPNDENRDGIHGIPNWSIDPESGARHLGRFGWKAGKGSLRQQVAGAFLLDMGVTTPAFPSPACQRSQQGCKDAAAKPAISSLELDRISSYMSLLGVPAQRNVASDGFTDGIVTPPELDFDVDAIAAGSQLFAKLGCTGCHVSELKTGNRHPFQELRDQVIHPYTDLLLHDLGEDLADTLSEGNAGPSYWRTSPLWGIGSLPYVQEGTGFANPASVRYLHDGRARTITEAVLWHGGEAEASRERFAALSRAERDSLLKFLASL